jgi:membrane protein YdbS with pleckstrin-like domain
VSESTSPRFPWLYEGIWGFLTHVFCLPREAPVLPTVESETVDSRKPSPAFISYLMVSFLVVFGGALLLTALLSIGLLIAAQSAWVLIVSLMILALIFVLAIIGYLAIHLRYDTTWYVFSDRSMRLRRGIWVIRESTITFENIQNVKVTQGPLQRFFGIANVVVETAGGGGSSPEHGAAFGMHAGLIEGVSDAPQIRDSIMSRVRQNSTSGLGDEGEPTANQKLAWSPRHLAVLREIRQLAQIASR